jgi:hypothetical protein
MIRQRKINSRKLAPLFLTLLLGAIPALAQPEAADTAGSSPASAGDGAADGTAATQQAPAPSEPAPKSSSAGTSTRSPFDYRSSEEISEDVPVSFPVDI